MQGQIQVQWLYQVKKKKILCVKIKYISLIMTRVPFFQPIRKLHLTAFYFYSLIEKYVRNLYCLSIIYEKISMHKVEVFQ